MAKRFSTVVDDEEIMLDVLETLLSLRLRVDGEDRRRRTGCHTNVHDAVLLDVSMPGIGGLRALEEFF